MADQSDRVFGGMMTVKQLKKELESVADDLIVILQKDSEGNGYAPLFGCDDNAIYRPKSGEVFNLSLPAYEQCMTKQEWIYAKETHPRCLVLYPTR
jgi:hypothetical protein